MQFLIFIGVLVLGYLGLIVARPSLREMSPMEVVQSLLGDTKDSLRKESLFLQPPKALQGFVSGKSGRTQPLQ